MISLWMKRYRVSDFTLISVIIFMYNLTIISSILTFFQCYILYSDKYFSLTIDMINKILQLISLWKKVPLCSLLYYLLLTAGYSITMVSIKLFITVSMMIGNIISYLIFNDYYLYFIFFFFILYLLFILAIYYTLLIYLLSELIKNRFFISYIKLVKRNLFWINNTLPIILVYFYYYFPELINTSFWFMLFYVLFYSN